MVSRAWGYSPRSWSHSFKMCFTRRTSSRLGRIIVMLSISAFFIFYLLCSMATAHSRLPGDRTLLPCDAQCFFLDQRFTVVMNGSESVVEAIAESTFTFSYDGAEWLKFKKFQDDASRLKSFTAIEGLCEGVCFTALLLFWLLLCSSMSKPEVMPTFLVVFPMPFLPLFFSKLDSPQSPFWRIVYRSFLPLLCLFTYSHDSEATNFFTHIGASAPFVTRVGVADGKPCWEG